MTADDCTLLSRPGPRSAVSDPRPPTPTVRVECIAWITRFVGGTGSGKIVFEEPLAAGDTVRRVLRRVSDRYPELHRALWDQATGELGEHIEVVVNSAVLDIRHTIDSPLAPGDVVTLVGQYIGG